MSVERESSLRGGLAARRARSRGMWLAAIVPLGCAAIAVAGAGVGTPSFADARSAAASPPAALAAAPAPPQAAAPRHQPAPVESDRVRFTGAVGPDLTRSLESAGVSEAQGREYVAALATVISLADGLSTDDRFDLVVLQEPGQPPQLAYAGLDRVGRSDVQLMKWTDGREFRWIDAEGLDPSAQAMALPVAGRVSSGFGQRFHPVLQRRRMHSGVDVAARYGAPIVAAADGTVVGAGWRGGYGRQVAIAHRDGVRTTYSHMSRMAVSPVSFVRRGQVIGFVGSSGLSTGPHLHYEVFKEGRRVNPLSVKLTQSPLQGEELHAFNSRMRALLVGQGGSS